MADPTTCKCGYPVAPCEGAAYCTRDIPSRQSSRSEPSEKVIMAMADCLLKTPNTITREEIINAWRVAVSERGDSHPDTEADGVVFCGKCGHQR